MRMILSFILLAFSVMAGAQNADSPKSKDTKAKEDQVSAAFKRAAVDALSCLDALDDAVLGKAGVFAAQKTKCKELVSKAELAAANKRERNAAEDLGTMQINAGICRSYAERHQTDDFSKCLKDNHELADTVKQEADLQTKQQS